MASAHGAGPDAASKGRQPNLPRNRLLSLGALDPSSPGARAGVGRGAGARSGRPRIDAIRATGGPRPALRSPSTGGRAQGSATGSERRSPLTGSLRAAHRGGEAGPERAGRCGPRPTRSGPDRLWQGEGHAESERDRPVGGGGRGRLSSAQRAALGSVGVRSILARKARNRGSSRSRSIPSSPGRVAR